MRYKTLSIIIISIIAIGLLFIIGCNNNENNSIPPTSSNLLLIDFKGECGESELDSNILKVKVLTAATCCVDFEGEIEYSDATINLKFIETGEPCDCICTSTLYYEIEGATSDDYNFKLNGKEIS
jgi:hypothetical protein